ncbi:hypothetical protein BGZ96_010070 [Linnemannia gamsii]|uniref:Uncharacterized protein n=1 Tax=Linnemannia gamsii TaxID=64522 RepID=A0ABQ7KCU7_9FUNG|nr:hypothetical protein BGZ96_010070 [Linnemannia gamsii]
MVHNKSLFQKRDPNSDACKEVKPTGFVMLAKLNKALQGYSSDDPQADDLIKVRKFETAMADANSNQDEDHYAKIKDAYVAAAEALRTSQNGKTKDVSVAAKDMMDTVDKIREKCKKP